MTLCVGFKDQMNFYLMADSILEDLETGQLSNGAQKIREFQIDQFLLNLFYW